MCAFLPRNSTSKGVLLMEALVALLLFVSMSTVIGSCWNYLFSIRSTTKSRLEGLSLAQSAAYSLIINHEQVDIKKDHTINYEYAPVLIESDLQVSLPSISLVTIQVANANKKAISLKAFYGEK